MSENIQIPTGIGGLVRFKEEYNSKFNLSPNHIIILIILIIGLRILLPLIFN